MSNKTLKANVSATASARKTRRKQFNRAAGVLFVAMFLVLFFGYQIARAPQADLRTVRAELAGETFWLDVAETSEARQRGLANHPELEPNEGMLFVFNKPDTHCFWMKDVEYAIDILWFNEQMELVHVEQSVPPESYPDNFCPPADASYVVELPAGTAQELELPEPTSLYVENL